MVPRPAGLDLDPDPILDPDLVLAMAPMAVAERQELLQPIFSHHLKRLLLSLRPPPTSLQVNSHFLPKAYLLDRHHKHHSIKINGPLSRHRFFPDHCLMPMQASKKTRTKIREPILKSLCKKDR